MVTELWTLYWTVYPETHAPYFLYHLGPLAVQNDTGRAKRRVSIERAT